MKSTAIWALVLLNVLLLGLLVGRHMKPNAAVAQVAAGRPGDYVIIPVDFPGSTVGSVVILDNASGQMSAILTEESTKRMQALPRLNIADLFARSGNTRR